MSHSHSRSPIVRVLLTRLHLATLILSGACSSRFLHPSVPIAVAASPSASTTAAASTPAKPVDPKRDAADRAYKAQDWKAAAAAYADLVRANPADGMAWLRLGISRHQLKDYAAAGPAYEKALELGVAPGYTQTNGSAACHHAHRTHVRG